MRSLAPAALLVAGLLALPACKRPGSGGGAASEPIRTRAAASQTPAVRDYYASDDAAALWTDSEGAIETADELLRRLCDAEAEGLDPAAYDVEALQGLRDSLAAPAVDEASRGRLLATFEVRASETFARFARDLGRGRVDRNALGAAWHLESDTLHESRALSALRQNGLQAALDTLAQHGTGYDPLRRALVRYRAIAQAGGWDSLAARGDTATLRRRLVLEGDLDSTRSEPLAAGVRRFQQRLGLDTTGTVNDSTFRALNVPVGQRIATLEANLERLRWMPSTYGPTYVLVNIPAYHLTVVENGMTAMEMPVIVGGDANRTPAFADTMQFLAFAPYWNVPASIASQELAGRSAGYYQSRGFEALRGNEVVPATGVSREDFASYRVRLRQKPGPQNSLGNVKFMFPNAHNIYLHDTPSGQLFSRQDRALSHGCIRVARPLDLAVWALRENEGWDSTRVDSAMNADTELRVDLKRRVPVYLVYQTAWADSSGRVSFRPDIYGHDRRLAAALYASPSDSAAVADTLAARDSAEARLADAQTAGTAVPDSLRELPPLPPLPDSLPRRSDRTLPAVCKAPPDLSSPEPRS